MAPTMFDLPLRKTQLKYVKLQQRGDGERCGAPRTFPYEGLFQGLPATVLILNVSKSAFLNGEFSLLTRPVGPQWHFKAAGSQLADVD